MYVLACIAPQRALNMGKRVLVLDDNAVSCNVVVTILGKAGYQTDARATIDDAFEVLARGQHRVLVADQHRGPIDGLAVARRVQAEHPSVSVVLLTGEGLRRLISAAEREGTREAVIAALGKTRLVVRGPKPVKALRDVGLVPTLVAAAPTTDGVIETLRGEALQGQTVGVQLYSESNPPLIEFLQTAGAKVSTESCTPQNYGDRPTCKERRRVAPRSPVDRTVHTPRMHPVMAT